MLEHLFRVAILQKSSLGRNYEGNTALVAEEMERAAELRADILLLPECFLTGYALPIGNGEALSDENPFIAVLCGKARTLSLGVVATAFTKGAQKPQNSAFLIDKNGEILMKYSKVHTCDFSYEACLESGTEFKVCDFGGVKLGVMICYDREYPESARVLMMKGAELILVPNDCGSMAPRVRAISTRAYENMVGIAMANPPGDNAGSSCAFSPICWDREGKCVDSTLLLADAKTSGLFVAEFNIDKLRAYRGAEMMGNTFRKVAAYGALMDRGITPPFIRARGGPF